MSSDDNPFLISVPPASVPKPEAAPAPDETPAPDPDNFITLPPGIVDSGTFRLPSPRAERQHEQTRSSAEIVFFPVVPGIPVQPTAVDEETRIAAPATPGWRIILPRSEQVVPLAGALYIGRNPARTADRQDAELLAVDDPAKSLSKTHALLEVDDDVLWVHDLDSTNGVYIVEPDASVIEVEPGRRAAVPAGAELELGEYVVRVDRV